VEIENGAKPLEQEAEGRAVRLLKSCWQFVEVDTRMECSA